MTNDILKIQEMYGNNVAELIRRRIPSVAFQHEGLVSGILIENFEPTSVLFDDLLRSGAINGFVKFISDRVDVRLKTARGSGAISRCASGKTETNEKEFLLAGYVKSKEGKQFKYNYCIDGTYFCPNNVVIKDGYVKRFDSERYELFDYFLLDKKKKKVVSEVQDGFVDEFADVEHIETVSRQNKNYRTLNVYKKDGTNFSVTLDALNRIIAYTNTHTEHLGNDYMRNGVYLMMLNLPSVVTAGDDCFCMNRGLTSLNMEKLETVGDGFMFRNENLTEANFPRLKSAGNDCFCFNQKMERGNFPSIEEVGKHWFYYNNNGFKTRFYSDAFMF